MGYDNEKWKAGAVASDGFIYCIPFNAPKILQIDARPIDMLYYKNTVGGANDSPLYDPDRLGYYKYAKALVNVTRSIEGPRASLCVGLLGEWGVGKTFLWKEVKGELEAISSKHIERLKKNIMDVKITAFDRSATLAFVFWCWIARNFSSMLCCCTLLKEEERIATMMILIFPIGLVVWCLVFVVSLLSFQIKKACIIIRIWFLSRMRSERYNTTCYHSYREEWENWFGVQVKKNRENDPLVFENIYQLLISRLQSNKDSNSKNDEEMQNNSENNLRWSDVREVLTGAVDVHKADSTKQYDQESFHAAVQLMLLVSFQNLVSWFKESIRLNPIFSKEYDVDDGMKKYIFVEFNVSVFIINMQLISNFYKH